MRRYSCVACVVAVGLAGCPGRDPATTRLAPGQRVRVRVEPPFVASDGPRPVVHLDDSGTGEVARDGDRAEVMADDRPADVRQGKRPDGDFEVDRRPVRVRMGDGREGELTRNELRPE